MGLTLILGGVGSGKSDFAETLVLSASGTPVYIATAEALDDEMRAKISAHQAKRAGAGWQTREAPRDLAEALLDLPRDAAILIDCATMLVSNHLLDGRDPDALVDEIIAVISACPAPLTVVSNEVGLGGVAATSLARRFAVAQGRLNRLLAEKADTVVHVIAGLPMVLKGSVDGD